MTDDSYETTRDEQRKSLDALEQSIRDRPQSGIGNSGHSISSYPSNGGPPDISRIGELSARGIDKISVETADQIREIGEAAVTRAEALRGEANALADSILEQGRRFSDRVASFTATAEAMVSSMNEQRARLHKSNS